MQKDAEMSRNEPTPSPKCQYEKCKFPKTCDWNRRCMQSELELSMRAKSTSPQKIPRKKGSKTSPDYRLVRKETAYREFPSARMPCEENLPPQKVPASPSSPGSVQVLVPLAFPAKKKSVLARAKRAEEDRALPVAPVGLTDQRQQALRTRILPRYPVPQKLS